MSKKQTLLHGTLTNALQFAGLTYRQVEKYIEEHRKDYATLISMEEIRLRGALSANPPPQRSPVKDNAGRITSILGAKTYVAGDKNA